MSGVTYRIGETQRILRDTFPSVDLSTIRYYEEQEMVKPARSKKGYRLFSESDIETLRFILQLREESVSIPEIRARLIDRGMLDQRLVTKKVQRAARAVAVPSVTRRLDPVPAPRPLTEPVPATTAADVALRVLPDLPVRRFAGYEFLAMTHLTPQTVNDLQSQGLVTPVVENGSTFFTSIDVEIALRAKVLLDQGLEVRHLLPLRRIAVMVGDYVETISRPLDELPEAERDAARAKVADEIRSLFDVIVTAQISAE